MLAAGRGASPQADATRMGAGVEQTDGRKPVSVLRSWLYGSCNEPALHDLVLDM
jgi:hypothetical protein